MPVVLKMLLAVGGLLVAAYGIIVVWCYRNQRRLLYSPTQRDAEGRGSRKFAPWRAATGEFLGYVRDSGRATRAVVVFHGNGGEALDREWLEELVPADQAVILAEYPGYGPRTGETSETAILAEANRLLDEIEKRWGKLPVVAVGESLGSGVACALAGAGRIAKIALIAPFSSARDVAVRFYPFIPVKWLLRDAFGSLPRIAGAKAPLHIVHGTLDETVPIDLARKLYETYPATKEFTEIPGFGHAQLEDAILHSPFTSRFRDFVAK